MIDAYLVQYCEKVANEARPVELPSPDADDVAFAWDDANEFRTNCAEKPRAQLGSFRQSPNQANHNLHFIFINPMILSYQPNGQSLRLWVASPSPGTAENTESE
jgi:hypothetical protein